MNFKNKFCFIVQWQIFVTNFVNFIVKQVQHFGDFDMVMRELLFFENCMLLTLNLWAPYVFTLEH